MKETQKQRLLKVLKKGKKVCQIDLNKYLALLEKRKSYFNTNTVDAIVELGIANLPARIFDLKKEGYDIRAKKIKCKGRFCNTFYYIYYLE